MAADPASTPGPLARRDGEPAFDEPWQAQVMALAFELVERGVFTATQWSEALGAELAARAARGEADDPAGYYQAALAALEALLERAGGVPREHVAERTEAWRRAYLATPHGQPVELVTRAGDRISSSN